MGLLLGLGDKEQRRDEVFYDKFTCDMAYQGTAKQDWLMTNADASLHAYLEQSEINQSFGEHYFSMNKEPWRRYMSLVQMQAC